MTIKSFTVQGQVEATNIVDGKLTASSGTDAKIEVPATAANWWSMYGDLDFNITEEFGAGSVYDAAGNLYVVGTHLVPGLNDHLLLLKYDANGTLLWSKSYTHGFGQINGESIIYDTTSGHLYVLTTQESSWFGVIELTTDGDIVREVHGDVDYEMNAWDLTIDPSGNLYVIGDQGVTNVNTGTSQVVFKLDSVALNFVWAKEFTLGHRVDEQYQGKGFGAVEYSNGYVYVTGGVNDGTISSVPSDPPLTQNYSYLAKLDATTGDQVWLQDTADGVGMGLCLDDADNVYTTYTNNTEYGMSVIAKFDSSGVFQWARSLMFYQGGGDTDINYDNGYVYATGVVYNNQSEGPTYNGSPGWLHWAKVDATTGDVVYQQRFGHATNLPLTDVWRFKGHDLGSIHNGKLSIAAYAYESTATSPVPANMITLQLPLTPVTTGTYGQYSIEDFAGNTGFFTTSFVPANSGLAASFFNPASTEVTAVTTSTAVVDNALTGYTQLISYSGTSGVNTWTFAADGGLVLPPAGNIVQNGYTAGPYTIVDGNYAGGPWGERYIAFADNPDLGSLFRAGDWVVNGSKTASKTTIVSLTTDGNFWTIVASNDWFISIGNAELIFTSLGGTWNFDRFGALNLTKNGVIRNQVDYKAVNIVGSGYVQLQWTTDAGAALTDPNGTSSSTNYIWLEGDGAHIQTNTNNGGQSYEWKFNNTGGIKFPSTYVNLHNGGVQYAEVLQFGNADLQSVITGPTPATGQSAQRLIIQGQNGGTGEGGDVYLWAGDAETDGGDIKIYAGDADGVSSGYGGYVNIAAGSGYNEGGGINITAGSSSAYTGGTISIHAGSGAMQNGSINLYTNNNSKLWLFGADGSLTLPNGSKLNNGTNYQFATDNSVTQSVDLRDSSGRGFYTGDDGYTLRSNGTYNWIFGGDGNLTLPAGGMILNQTAGYASPTSTTRSAGTKIVLFPQVGTNNDIDYALGIAASTMWFSVPTNSSYFKFYNGVDNNTVTIDGTGKISANSVDVTSLNVSGSTTFMGPVTFSGTATYVLSTNTVYTDNIIELHTHPGGVGTTWASDDGKDIGFRFHHYANSTDTNAALVLANDTKYLEWYGSGAESTSSGVIANGTYGTFKTGSIQLTENLTVSGTIAVSGGGRINPRVVSTTTSATLTWSSNNSDQQNITALGTALTISADSGTPVAGQKMMFYITDNGTNRALTWATGTNGFKGIGVSLPGSTTAGKITYVGCVYNAINTRWDVIAVAQEA